MKTGKPEPFTLLGTTSSIDKDTAGPIALSPTRSWVAESGKGWGGYVVRITDYATGNTVRQTNWLAEPPTVLAFSPNGQDLLICTRSGDFVSSQRWTNGFWTWRATFLNAAAWLDNDTVILACYWSSDGIPPRGCEEFLQTKRICDPRVSTPVDGVWWLRTGCKLHAIRSDCCCRPRE